MPNLSNPTNGSAMTLLTLLVLVLSLPQPDNPYTLLPPRQPAHAERGGVA